MGHATRGSKSAPHVACGDRIHAFDPRDPPRVLNDYPLLWLLLAAWRRWAGTNMAPRRQDIDPVQVPALLPHIVLLDVLEDDFRFRLVGEAVNERYGRHLRGATLGRLLSGATRDDTLREHRMCAEDGLAVLTRNKIECVSLGDMQCYGRLLLPIDMENGRASHILGAMEFIDR